MKQALYLSSLEGIKKSAKKNGIKVKLINYAEQVNAEETYKAAIIISLSIHWTLLAVEKLRRLQIRPILVGAAVDSFDNSFSGPTIDRYDLVYKQVDYLISAGCSRIAFVGSEDNDINDNIRKQAFLHTMKFFKQHVCLDDVFVESSDGCIEKFLNVCKRYDGAICVNDYIGVELLYRANQHGVSIPSDLLVIGSGNFQISQTIKPSLSTTTLDYYKMGRLAIDILQVLNSNPYVDKVQITLPCEIVVRESTNNIPYSAKAQHNFINPEEPQKTYLGEPKKIGQSLLQAEIGLRHCTKTDLAILESVRQGQSIDKIAEKLFMSVGAINYRLKKIYKNFNVENKAELETLVSSFMPFVSRLIDER